MIWLLGNALAESCKGAKEDNLDWLFYFRMPGYGIYYYTSLMSQKNLTKFQVHLKHNSERLHSPLFNTIGQHSSYNRIQFIWNDDPISRKTNNMLAKSKGIFMWENQSDHSVLIAHGFSRYPAPKFQNDLQSFMNPQQGKQGGHMFCFKEKSKKMQNVLDQLAQMRPNLQNFYVVKGIDHTYYQFADSNLTAKSKYTTFLTTYLANRTLLVLTKPASLLANLWLELAQEINDNFTINLRGGCPQGWNRVHTIRAYKTVGQEKVILGKDDKSRWALGRSTEWVCVGDHQMQQAKQGGSVYCKLDGNLHKAMQGMINQAHPCEVQKQL